jgi:hypothetical protein
LEESNNLGWREQPLSNQNSAHSDHPLIIHFQNLNSRSANTRNSHQYGPPPSEMCLPFVSPGVKQTHQAFRSRINPRDIGAFVIVAVKAGRGEIASLAPAAVLAGDYVVLLKRREVEPLNHPAVFADGI